MRLSSAGDRAMPCRHWPPSPPRMPAAACFSERMGMGDQVTFGFEGGAWAEAVAEQNARVRVQSTVRMELISARMRHLGNCRKTHRGDWPWGFALPLTPALSPEYRSEGGRTGARGQVS